MEASHVNILNINGFLIFFTHLEGSRVVKRNKKGLYHKQLKLEKYICIESHSIYIVYMKDYNYTYMHSSKFLCV